MMDMRSRIGGPSGRRRVATIAVVALLLSTFTSNRAAAEIIILKNGTRIPCRILVEGKEEIIARIAGGMEVTYRMRDIARIDRSISSVEIYEAVAERISDAKLTSALYLGYWCLENGLKKNAKRFFDLASQDNVIAARAYLASAKLAGSEAARARSVAMAIAADPSLKEALDAVAKSSTTLVELPEDLVRMGSQLFVALHSRSTRDIAQLLTGIERYPGVAARTAYAEKFRAFTGLSFADIRKRCGSKRGATPRKIAASGNCVTCRNTGYTRCPICQGKGYKLCRTCKGLGTRNLKKRSSRGGKTRTTTSTCSGCKGVGGRDCRSCARLPGGAVNVRDGVTGEAACYICRGTGSKEMRSTSPYTRETTVTTVICLSCKGTGRLAKTHRIDLKITSSGKRRCKSCNRDGSIPLPGAGSRRTPTHNLSAATVVTTRGILTPDEKKRLSALAQIFVLSKKNTGLQLLAGPRIPFSFTVAEGNTVDSDEVFAFGRWCRPSTMKIKAMTAKALRHEPRTIDISKFCSWMRDKELGYLRERSKPVGSGKAGGSGTAEVKALVAALECTRRAGVGSGLEQSTVLRTTFKPGRSSSGYRPLTYHLDVSARGVALVLLSDTTSWPGNKVILAPLPTEPSGFDFEPVARALRSKPQALTLYYRIRSSRGKSTGQGLAAMTHTVIAAEVLAATTGPTSAPTKVWLRGAISP